MSIVVCTSCRPAGVACHSWLTPLSCSVSRDVSTAAWAALDEVDVGSSDRNVVGGTQLLTSCSVFVIVDAVKTIDSDLKFFFARLKDYRAKFQLQTGEVKDVVLVLNKLDLLEEFDGKQAPYPAPDRFRHHFSDLDEIFTKVISISALMGSNAHKVLEYAMSKAEDRPWMYPKTLVRHSGCECGYPI